MKENAWRIVLIIAQIMKQFIRDYTFQSIEDVRYEIILHSPLEAIFQSTNIMPIYF